MSPEPARPFPGFSEYPQGSTPAPRAKAACSAAERCLPFPAANICLQLQQGGGAELVPSCRGFLLLPSAGRLWAVLRPFIVPLAPPSLRHWEPFAGATTYAQAANDRAGAGGRSRVHNEPALINERAARLRGSHHAPCVGSRCARVPASGSGSGTAALLGRRVLPGEPGLPR